MIKCEGNKVSINGTKKELIVELMTLVHIIEKKGVADRDEILEYIVFALMTNEEAKEMLIDAIDEMDNIGDALMLLGALK